ncbi:small acid-soluble spore protein P [Texcoconibacillus texcoconensis]|uniref:Small acid-soluble spore protein P (Minor) n=1 Tax=Texcoconibacillus texcoconensis TaxID=1095777 RepID=A0A840QT60_9BACI|nr:small acid-soluble spore protein P [Texcoconibacillus texcoconensis]MBB5174457.1 small acid-soluble spore protein P (minor) [Texcoconibacillus texcoconensis]
MQRHNAKDPRRNAQKGAPSHQPEPMKGSKKTKKANHVSQTDGEG